MFSCEFCEISKNTFSYKTPLAAASNLSKPSKTVSIRGLNSINLSLKILCNSQKNISATVKVKRIFSSTVCQYFLLLHNLIRQIHYLDSTKAKILIAKYVELLVVRCSGNSLYFKFNHFSNIISLYRQFVDWKHQLAKSACSFT